MLLVLKAWSPCVPSPASPTPSLAGAAASSSLFSSFAQLVLLLGLHLAEELERNAAPSYPSSLELLPLGRQYRRQWRARTLRPSRQQSFACASARSSLPVRPREKSLDYRPSRWTFSAGLAEEPAEQASIRPYTTSGLHTFCISPSVIHAWVR